MFLDANKRRAGLWAALGAERERELRREGREVPSRVRLREGPIGVRITLGQPTIVLGASLAVVE